MGMYTEVLARGRVSADAPDVVGRVLRTMIYGDLPPHPLPSHPFFSTGWRWFANGQSAYHPTHAQSVVRTPYRPDEPQFTIHSDLKNYNSEIAKFFDWIDPYLEAEPGEFMGYELYEEDHAPVLYFKKES